MGLVRILTLNIWNRSGPWEHRLPLIQKGIAELAPDIVGLQEVVFDPADPPRGQAHEIARAFSEPRHIAFAPAWAYASGEQFGNALVSRFPIVEQQTIELPTTDSRCILYCRVQMPQGILPVFVTHLSWRLEEGWMREEQVLAIAGHVKRLEKEGELPAVLMGDLNANPDATEVRFLRGLHALEKQSICFIDAFERCGRGPGPTWDPASNPHAALSHEGPRRIDYVMVRGPRDDGLGMPVSARVVFDEVVTEGDLRYAPSDHYGVVAEVRV